MRVIPCVSRAHRVRSSPRRRGPRSTAACAARGSGAVGGARRRTRRLLPRWRVGRTRRPRRGRSRSTPGMGRRRRGPPPGRRASAPCRSWMDVARARARRMGSRRARRERRACRAARRAGRLRASRRRRRARIFVHRRMMRIDPWRVGPAPASRRRIARRRDRIGLAPYARRRRRAMTTRSPHRSSCQRARLCTPPLSPCCDPTTWLARGLSS